MLPSQKAKLLYGGVPKNLKEAAMQANTPEKQAFCLSCILDQFKMIYKVEALDLKPTQKSMWYAERKYVIDRIKSFFPPLNHREQA